MIDTIPAAVAIPVAALLMLAYFILLAVQNSREEKRWAAIEAQYDDNGHYIGDIETGHEPHDSVS